MPPEGESPPPRSSTRVAIDAEVLLEFENFGGFIREVSANLSLGGMFIKTRYLKPVGTVVRFEFRLADHLELIHGTGKVVWTRWRDQGPEAPAGMGIQFMDLDEPSQLMVGAIVEQHVQQGGQPFELAAAGEDTGTGNWVREPLREPSPPPAGSAASAEELGGLEVAQATAEADAPTDATFVAEDPMQPPETRAAERGAAAPGVPAGRHTAPWPALLTIPEPATSPDVLVPPDQAPPPGPAAEPESWAPVLLAETESPHWSPPPIPERAPAPRRPARKRQTRRWIGLGAALLALVVLGVGAYVSRDRLIGLVTGRAAQPAARRAAGPAPAASEARRPVVAVTPSALPPGQAPAVVNVPGRTLHEDLSHATASPTSPVSAETPRRAAPTPAVPTPAAPQPAAPQAAAPQPAAAMTIAPSAGTAAREPAFTSLLRIRWEPSADGLVLVLECDGAVPMDRIEHSRLEQPEPREVIKLLGVRRPFDSTRIAVGQAQLKQVRIGYHETAGRAELHVVLDLSGQGIGVLSLEPQGRTLRVHLGPISTSR